jgi:DeoR/GlpR family transcriptional regulator of sugar metabolism
VKAAGRARRRQLLAEIERTGRITTGQAHRFYRATGYGPCRTTARKDLQALARQGALLEHGPDNERAYHLNTAKGGTR